MARNEGREIEAAFLEQTFCPFGRASVLRLRRDVELDLRAAVADAASWKILDLQKASTRSAPSPRPVRRGLEGWALIERRQAAPLCRAPSSTPF